MPPDTLAPNPSGHRELTLPQNQGSSSDLARVAGFYQGLRFYLGVLGLFTVYLTLFLAAWAVVPSLVPGWTSVVISSGSMAPAIQSGDVVIAIPSDGTGLSPGTVAVMSDPGGNGLVTHRIVAVNPDGTYRTRGDANQLADSTPVLAEDIVAVGRLLVPYVGLPLVWYWDGAWAMLATWGLVIVLSLWAARYAYEPLPHGPGSLEVDAASASRD